MSITSTSTNSAIAVDDVALDAGQDLELVTDPPVSSDSQAQATVVTGDASATADNIAAGFKDLEITNVGQEALLNALVSGTTISSSRSVTGETTSDANSSIAAGMSQTQIDNIGTNATILGQQTMVTNADAGSISGNATATALLGQIVNPTSPLDSLNAVGGIVGWNNTFTIGQDAQITGRSGISTNRNSTGSLATSVTGDSNASTQVPSNFGISLNELSIGEEGTVIGEVAADQSAQSVTTTGVSNATVQTTRTAGLQVAGFDNRINQITSVLSGTSGPPFTIGTDGSLNGKALLDSSASASSVTQTGSGFGVTAIVGGELSPSGEQTVYGISLPGTFDRGNVPATNPSGLLSVARSADKLRIGMDGGINADATVTQAAEAEVVTGSAFATGVASPNTLIAGLGGNLSIHNNATELSAVADLTGSSSATSVTGDAVAINGNQYADLDLGTIGSAAATPSSGFYPGYSLVNGIGGELPSSVVIGADLAGGALFKGISELSASATSVTGEVLALNAGQVFGSRSVNFDIGNSILNANGSRGTATFQANGSASSEANTITADSAAGGAVASAVMQGAGYVGTPLNPSQLSLTSPGNTNLVNNTSPTASAIEIGLDGNLNFVSIQSASSSASAITSGPLTVRPPLPPSSNVSSAAGELGYRAGAERTAAGAVATSVANSFGLAPYYVSANSPVVDSNTSVELFAGASPTNELNLLTALNPQDVTIGGSGNISAVAANFLVESEASNVTGSALSLSDSNSVGINLLAVTDNDTNTSSPTKVSSDIRIGDTGSVLGSAGGTMTSAASTITGESFAINNIDSAGIFGTALTSSSSSQGLTTDDLLPSITAGPNGGSITGNAFVMGGTESSSITGNSTAETNAELGGIVDVTLTGGQVAGSNAINARVVGDLETAASTVTGDATANSAATAAGIFYQTSDPGSINVNGNINAIAELSNTVTATTITGNATATVSNSVVGLGNANITIGQSGSITASAVSNSSAIAQSITA